MASPVDPFTRASPSYQAAIRRGYKTGQAWEGYAPRSWSLKATLGRLLVLACLGVFWYALWRIWSGG